MSSITHELRDWFKDRMFMANGWKEIHDIADRIDAELAERYVELPLDADGVPIHVGDKLTDDAMRKSDGEVCRLMLESDGWHVGFSLGGWSIPRHHKWHHQQPDTWERIIEDAIREGFERTGLYTPADMDYGALVARCKALAREQA